MKVADISALFTQLCCLENMKVLGAKRISWAAVLITLSNEC